MITWRGKVCLKGQKKVVKIGPAQGKGTMRAWLSGVLEFQDDRRVEVEVIVTFPKIYGRWSKDNAAKRGKDRVRDQEVTG